MKFIYRRFVLSLCAGALVLGGCSSNNMPSTAQGPSEAAQSVINASSYVRLMSDTVSVANVGGFKITSATFGNNGTIPKSMVGNSPPTCAGGDLSPILYWSNVPAGAKSLALVLFDETANYGHWGIYNMRYYANRLPQGVKPGNIPGLWMQVYDDNILNGILTQGYTGPCPPPGIAHHYVFTLYALNTSLTIPNNGFVPPTIETLLYYMIGHVIGRASITGLYQAH